MNGPDGTYDHPGTRVEKMNDTPMFTLLHTNWMRFYLQVSIIIEWRRDSNELDLMFLL